MRPPSPKNNLTTNLHPPSSTRGGSKSPLSDRSISPRPASSRGSSPMQPPNGNGSGLPPAQGKNTWEMKWAPKQPKVPSTPITPRDQRSAPLLSPSITPAQSPRSEGSEGQRSPREVKDQQLKSNREGHQAKQQGVLKPQPLQVRELI